MTKISNRLNLLKGYFSTSRDFPFTITDTVKAMARRPCTRLGRAFIESIDQAGDYLVVKLSPETPPLYWPCVLPVFDLYKVVTECFCENDWHFYEVPQTRVLPGDVVVDCGASEGIFSLRVLNRAAHIVAFEPLPIFISSLRKTFSGSPKVAVVPCALGSDERTAFLNGRSLYGTVERTDNGGTPIQVTTIDEYVKRAGIKVDFIKADVESLEFEVLQGARNTIARYRPRIALTVYHPGNDWREICEFLRSLVPQYSYRIKGISYNQNKTRPVMIHLWVD